MAPSRGRFEGSSRGRFSPRILPAPYPRQPRAQPSTRRCCTLECMYERPAGPVTLPEHRPVSCPFGHDLRPGSPMTMGWFPCQCPSAVEHKAAREEESGWPLGPPGHYYVWCERCKIEHPHRDTMCYLPSCSRAEEPKAGPVFRPPGIPDGCRCARGLRASSEERAAPASREPETQVQVLLELEPEPAPELQVRTPGGQTVAGADLPRHRRCSYAPIAVTRMSAKPRTTATTTAKAPLMMSKTKSMILTILFPQPAERRRRPGHH